MLLVPTNILHRHAMVSLSWPSPNVEKGVELQHGRHSHLPFHAKEFIWRVVIGGLPLGSAFKRRGLGLGTILFCTVNSLVIR